MDSKFIAEKFVGAINDVGENETKEAMTIKIEQDEYSEYEIDYLNDEREDESIPTDITFYPSLSETQNHSSWGTLPWLCHNCKETFSNYKTFSVHQQTNHVSNKTENIRYQCMECTEACIGYPTFLNHLRQFHYINLRLSCDVCDQQCSDYEKLSKHRLLHSTIANCEYPNVFYCTECGIAFSTQNEVTIHFSELHDEQRSMQIDEDFRCTLCEMMFESRESYKAHVKTHVNEVGPNKVSRQRTTFLKRKITRLIEWFKIKTISDYAKHQCNCVENNKSMEKMIKDLKETIQQENKILREQLQVAIEAIADMKVIVKRFHRQSEEEQALKMLFPVESGEQLQKMNIELNKDNRATFIKMMTDLLKPAGVQKNLKYILTDAVVQEYNVDGVQGKKSLKALDNFYSALLESIPNTDAGPAETQLRRAIHLQKNRFLKAKCINNK